MKAEDQGHIQLERKEVESMLTLDGFHAGESRTSGNRDSGIMNHQ